MAVNIVITDEQIYNIARMITSVTGLAVTPRDVEEVLNADSVLAGEVLAWGHDDTVVRENLCEEIRKRKQ